MAKIPPRSVTVSDRDRLQTLDRDMKLLVLDNIGGKGSPVNYVVSETLLLPVNATPALVNLHDVALARSFSDRIIGFSPIPAMSMLSFAAGSRFLQLLGGVNLSFYDWYCDLPNASPEIWGEQTDVAESADWYNSKYIAVMGSNLNMTRTPDCHFAAEARHNGSKMYVFAPDFNQVAKMRDLASPRPSTML